MSQTPTTQPTVEFSPAAAQLAEKLLTPALEILARYPAGRERSALLPLLHLVQTEEGFVSPRGVTFCAEILGINKAQVGAVATFYTMYKRRPTGEYLVSVCTNTLCNVMGGQEVYDGLVEHLGVGHDETTGDGKITLEHAECLAACDYAPVVTVNYDFAIDQATPDSAVAMVEQLRNGERPTLSRGARVCSLKDMAFQLAGFADEREGALTDGPAGAPTLRGVTLAQEHGIAVSDFNLDTPITKTKPAREGKPADTKAGTAKADSPKSDSKVASVARKAAGAVKAAAATVVDAVEHHKAPPAKTADVNDDGRGGDVKDPEVRAAEQRHPEGKRATDAADPTPPADGPPPTGADAQAAQAAGTEGSVPAGDGKPAGDSDRGESIVSETLAEQKPATTDANPGWQNAQRGNEEKK